MLLSLVIYASLVTALAAGAAWALERVLRALGLPTRWVWVAAMLVAVLATLVGLPSRSAGPGLGPAEPFVPIGSFRPGTSGAPLLGALEPAARFGSPSVLTVPTDFDPLLAGLWVLLSAGMLAGLARGYRALRRERTRWRADTVDGTAVLLSEGRGPAVVGVARPEIVVPRWLTRMDRSDQRLLLDHEIEHVAAGDSRLLASSLVLLALLPWNLALWWIVARLRQALEIDCDRRVLKGSPGVRRYASLLIDVGARAGRPRFALLTFASPALFLERRIKAMTDPKRPQAFRTTLFALLGALFIGGACYVEQVQVHIDEDERVPDVAVEGVKIGPAAVAEMVEAVREDSDEVPPEADDVDREQAERAAVAAAAKAVWPFRVELEYDGKRLAGTVRDRATGDPIGQAQVFFPELEMGGLTRADGRFLILNVPPGSHELSVKHLAHGEATSTLMVPAIADEARSRELQADFLPWAERELATMQAAHEAMLRRQAATDGQPTPEALRVAETMARMQSMLRTARFGQVHRVTGGDADRPEVVERVEASIRARRVAATAEEDRELPRLPANKSSIVGAIVDADGEPIAGAQISIPSLSIGALTNAQGRFLLLNVPIGKHFLKIQKDGFQESEAEAEVIEGPVGKSLVVRLREIDPNG